MASFSANWFSNKFLNSFPLFKYKQNSFVPSSDTKDLPVVAGESDGTGSQA